MTHTTYPIKIGVIGTGKQFFSHYVDILLEFKKRGLVEIVGVQNRTESKGRKAADLLACPYYPSVSGVLNNAEAIINVLKGEIKHKVSVTILKNGKDLFMETPAGYRSSDVRELARLAKQHELIVEIAEDNAFYPEAQLQSETVKSGLMGKVLAVFNDEKYYAYHPIARLHTLVGTLPAVTSYETTTIQIKPGTKVNQKHFSFESNLHYFERFLEPKDHFLRLSGGWKILCERGVLTDEYIIFNESGETSKYPIMLENKSMPSNQGCVGSLTVTVKETSFSWISPWPLSWTKRHTSLADMLRSFLEATHGSGNLLYGLEKAQTDIKLWRAGELALKFSSFHNPNILHALERGATLKNKLRALLK